MNSENLPPSSAVASSGVRTGPGSQGGTGPHGTGSGSRPPSLFDAYRSSGDEVVQDGTVAAPYLDVVHALDRLGPGTLARRRLAAQSYQQSHGVEFRVTGDPVPRTFPVDPIPRVVAEAEWSALSRGLEQRARALDALLCDVYGEQAAIRDGALPRWVAEVPGYSLVGSAFRGQPHRAQVCGMDLVRDAGGAWHVLEDNVRVPSGLAYAIHNRRMVDAVMPELPRPLGLCDASRSAAMLRSALGASAPARVSGEARVVLLSEGPGGSAWFEHSMLASEMGVDIVLARELLVEVDCVYQLRQGAPRLPVDVIYLRMSESELSTAAGADGLPLGPRLVAAARAGRVAVANALGNGVADDKAVYSYLPAMIQYYLGEKPVLGTVPTYLCRQEEHRRHVVSHLGELVLKPVDGYGGSGVVVGSMASEEELDALRGEILAHPASWIAQETVQLSTHPNMSERGLEARHVDLRAFVLVSDVAAVAPAALTRVAPAGSMIVNSSRGGGSKDTWLVCGASGGRRS